MIWILFGIAGVLVVIAAYVTFKPNQSAPKQIPKSAQLPDSSVDNGGGEGNSSATSADVTNSSLDLDTGEAEVSADEV